MVHAFEIWHELGIQSRILKTNNFEKKINLDNMGLNTKLEKDMSTYRCHDQYNFDIESCSVNQHSDFQMLILYTHYSIYPPKC